MVATRPPAQNGLGLPLTRALENLDAVLDRMRILEEDVKVAAQLLDLLRAAPVRGKRVHDAGLAATMLAHRVEAIVTSHPSDFRPFADRLRVIDLADC